MCLPIGIARAFVPFFEWIAKVTHTRALYTRYSLYTISSNSHFTHDKATAEPGYHPRDMQDTIPILFPGCAGIRFRLKAPERGTGRLHRLFRKEPDAAERARELFLVKRQVFGNREACDFGVRINQVQNVRKLFHCHSAAA